MERSIYSLWKTINKNYYCYERTTSCGAKFAMASCWWEAKWRRKKTEEIVHLQRLREDYSVRSNCILVQQWETWCTNEAEAHTVSIVYVHTIDLKSSKGRSSMHFFFLSYFRVIFFRWKTCICKKANEFYREKNFIIKCQLVHTYSVHNYYSFFLLHFLYNFFAPASFSILSPRIICD